MNAPHTDTNTAAWFRERMGPPHADEATARQAMLGAMTLAVFSAVSRADGTIIAADSFSSLDVACHWKLSNADSKRLVEKLAAAYDVIHGARLVPNPIGAARQDIALRQMLDRAMRGLAPYGREGPTRSKDRKRVTRARK